MKLLPYLLFMLLGSCGLLPRATSIPVKTLVSGKPNGQELVVFLPGRWSRVEEFQREKFFETASARWPEAKLLAPDLHLGYYKNQSVAHRLHDDVILPAKRTGVKTIRLVGVSMGGLGALMYDVKYPGQVDEMILLSPFLGEKDALHEIDLAGSLEKWQPGTLTERDYSRKLWLKLREKWQVQGKRPRVSLGCGSDDRLASSNRLFAREFLSSTESKWIAGDHDWPTWRSLFQRLIEK